MLPVHRSRRRMALTGLALVLSLAVAGCGPPRAQTTRLGSADLIAMTDDMVASLARAEALSGRGPDPEPWRIVMHRAVNRSADVIPRREREAFLARLRAKLNESDLLRRKNVVFLAEAETAEAEPQTRPSPTHVMTATIHALTRVSRETRSDAYVVAFTLMNARTAGIVWEDRYEVKLRLRRNRFD